MATMLRYAVTDPSWYEGSPERLTDRIADALRRHRPHMITLRDKNSNDYETLARLFLSLRSDFPETRFLLHTHLTLARELDAGGIHLPSDAIERIPEAKAAGLFTVVSTHTLQEALECRRLGADAVTFSPVFASPGKGRPQGLEKLKEIRDKISIKLIALGGIVTEEQIRAVERTGADGFASIRYFAP